MTATVMAQGPVDVTVRRLEALLPELEYSRETHVQWRDCPQHCRDRNPEIGSADFHAKTVLEYDERIAAIREAISELQRRSDIMDKQGVLILMQEQELLDLRGPLFPTADDVTDNANVTGLAPEGD